MIVQWLVASIHLLALGVGFAGVFFRARALRGPLDAAGLGRVFMADNLWGVAAMLWIGSGVYRLFALDKGLAYYLATPWFHAKMGMFGLAMLLELWPMVVLIRWRLALRKGEPVDTAPARKFAIISDVETLVIMLMVLAAAAMARGMS